MARRKKTIHIGVASVQDIKSEVLAAWKAAERVEGPQGSDRARLYFADAATLLKTLTPRRFELLRALRRRRPLHARALAAALKRGHKNVATDVKALAHIGLIKTDVDGRFHVPWDRISTHIELAA